MVGSIMADYQPKQRCMTLELKEIQYLPRVKVTPCSGSPPFDLSFFGTLWCQWDP